MSRRGGCVNGAGPRGCQKEGAGRKASQLVSSVESGGDSMKSQKEDFMTFHEAIASWL